MPVIATTSTNPVQANLVARDPGQGVQQGAAVDACKSKDATPAPTPALRRAFCFDLAKDGAQIVPQPPPANTGWSPRPRDPVLIELGEIELGAHLEFISLTDHPDATFESNVVRRLDFTGYDVAGRIGTAVLTPEEMATKGFQPGERIVLRQVDKNGNASDGIFVHLDPNSWAGQQVRQPDDNGNQITLRGAQINFNDGMTGIAGATGAARHVIGTAVRDVDAPKLIENNVTLKTFSYSKEEVEVAKELRSGETRTFINTVLRRTHFTLTEAKQLVARADVTPKAKETLEKLLANEARMFDKIEVAYDPGVAQKDQVLGDTDTDVVLRLGDTGRDVYLQLDKALEPGATIRLQNSRSGQTWNASVAANARSLTVRLDNMRDGDPLILTYRDAAQNEGKPYAMEYSGKCADGKATYNPLSVRYGGSSIGRD